MTEISLTRDQLIALNTALDAYQSTDKGDAE